MIVLFFVEFQAENWYWSMGTLEEDKHEADGEYYSEKIVKTYENCLWSVLVSMAGGLVYYCSGGVMNITLQILSCGWCPSVSFCLLLL